jgi:hypothetical protein
MDAHPSLHPVVRLNTRTHICALSHTPLSFVPSLSHSHLLIYSQRGLDEMSIPRHV